MNHKKYFTTTVDSRFLQTCDIALKEFKVEPFTIVIFGGAGDLSRRKLLPTLYHLHAEKELPAYFSVLGFGMPQMTDAEYRNVMKDAIKKSKETIYKKNEWDEFSKRLFYISSDFGNDKNYKKLAKKLSEITVATKKGSKDVIYYMAVPPKFTPVIVEKLKQNNLSKGVFKTKIIVEKPFGRDHATAVKLNQILTASFDEHQIYRIDHYLGKETVQNIIFFRFSNSIFEPLWNHRYIDSVQITVAESLGIEHRGAFYEQAGVVRDIMQNHMMQLIGLIAMEPPAGFDPDYIRDEKVKIFRSIRDMDTTYIDEFAVRGQYGPGKIERKAVPGYREENNVAPNSNTPTFIAAKLYIDNWRWAGVPFYIRTGKRMPKRITQICIQFTQPPLRLFGRTCDVLQPNLLVLTIQPQEKISLRFGIKYPQAPNKIYPVLVDFSYQDAFHVKSHPPYERLLIDSMKGDPTLFVRQDGVEAMWRVVDSIISRWESTPAPQFPNYAAGTWGPKEADTLLEKEGRAWKTV